MNTSTLILDAQQDGVKITLTPAGKIHLEGGQAQREKWAGIVKMRRDEIVEALKAASDAPSWRWLLHFADRESVEVSFSPEVNHDEVLGLYPAALAAEPIVSTPNTGQAVPLTTDEEQAIRVWLTSISETDPAIIGELMERCQRDANTKRGFLGQARQETKAESFDREGEAVAWLEDDRRRCVHCLNLLPNGICKVAEPGGMVQARKGYRPHQDWLQRCPGYQPCPDDPDRRTGAERWSGLPSRATLI